MKNTALELINDQLSHKKRTESDLIRYICTRDSNDTCNYALLLGAGASVTSGIRTGIDLINEWTLELYERYSENPSDSLQVAESYLSDNESSWYNPLNKYSTLFEKKFDLPSQRRRFVEQEVDGKLPSIGYAYLTSLCEKNYFNTIFTTNFDDLVNEAFYQFSNIRPIHCAHDSSVNSISLSSKRPKILKLHGDYLFDDIKSTLRETESLEQNTKDKFSESCKEYGLIVIGYSGNDRSVMDVLEFLSKQENYLTNGIYWCLRPEDQINQALKNLLWKDKVYPVLINGFDELMAKLHSKAISKNLMLTPNSKESKLRKSITSIIKDEYNLSKTLEIKEEIAYLKNESDKSEVSLLISDLTFGENSSESLKQSTLKDLVEIDSLIKKGLYHEAYTQAEKCLEKVNEKDSHRYIQRLISITEKQKDNHLKSKWLRRLLETDKNNIHYIIHNSRIKPDLDDQISYLKKIEKDSLPRFQLQDEIARIHLMKCDEGIDISEKSEQLNLALERLQESLKINQTISNPSWSRKLSTLKRKHRLLKDDDSLDKIKSMLDDLSEIEKKDKLVLLAKLELCDINEKKISAIPNQKSAEIINELIAIYNLGSKTEKEWIKSNLISHASKHYFRDDRVLECRSIFSSAILKEHESSAYSLLFESEYHLYLNADIEKSKESLRKSLKMDDITEHLKKAFEISSLVDQELFEEFRIIYQGEKNNLDPDEIFECELEILTHDKAFSEAEDLIKIRSEEIESKNFMLESRTYYLLKQKRYREAISLATPFGKLMQTEDGDVLFINYIYAKKQQSSQLTSSEQTRLRNLMASSPNFGVKACAELLTGGDQQVKSNLVSMMKNSLKTIYALKDWPITEKSPFIESALKLLEKSGIKYIDALTKN